MKEAKGAKIPVILTDRAVDSQDKSLCGSFLGPDFIKEGESVGTWVKENFADQASAHVAELQGTTGSAPANDRAKGFRNIVGSDPRFKIVASQTGDFTRALGKQVMEAFLKSHPGIHLVFAHNDDMGIGAIEAIEATGKVPGKDIKIVTIDAVKDGMQALANGKSNFIAECSPLLGDQRVSIVKDTLAGTSVEPRSVTEETTLTQDQAVEALPDRKY